MRAKTFPTALAVVLFFILHVLPAGAELQGDQVLIIANAKSPDSLRLAKLYASLRNIPPVNIIAINCPTSESISRDQYNRRIADPVRSFINGRNLTERIKALVTVYGVPLKVGAAKPTAAQLKLVKKLEPVYTRHVADVEGILNQLLGIARVATTQPATLPAREAPGQFSKKLPDIRNQFNNAMIQIKKQMRREVAGESRRNLTNRVRNLQIRLQGPTRVIFHETERGLKKRLMAKRIRQAQQRMEEMLADEPDDSNIGPRYNLAIQLGGHLGVLKAIADDVARLKQKDSLAAVDSELPLVAHPQYMLAGRIPNLLNVRFTESRFAAKWQPIFMVARLDGPGPEVVERMIRDSVKIEQSGLAGKVYIDARGIKARTTFAFYDQELLRLGVTLEKESKLQTVLDTRPELFPPGSCPKAAIYCGWYSLKKYVDAFQFVPGAVAFHIASFEAASLRDRNSSLWCPRLLQAGAAATIGPVAEPYLDGFPRPSEFFQLLLCGKYSLAEAFFMTNRYNSWRVILIGDPLYRPFAKNPQLPVPEITGPPLPVALIQ